MTTSIKLGDKVKDKISDFSGIVSAKCTYLHESTMFGVTPAELDRDGNKRDIKWFEETGLDILA